MMLNIATALLTEQDKTTYAYFTQIYINKYHTVMTNPQIQEQKKYEAAQASTLVKKECITKATEIYKNMHDSNFVRKVAGISIQDGVFNLTYIYTNQSDLLAPPPDTTNMNAKEAKDAEKTWTIAKEEADALDTIRNLIKEQCTNNITNLLKKNAPIAIAASVAHLEDIENIMKVYSITYNHKDARGEANLLFSIVKKCRDMTRPTTSLIGEQLYQLTNITDPAKAAMNCMPIFIATALMTPENGPDRNKLAQKIILDFESPDHSKEWTLENINQHLRIIETTEKHSPSTTAALSTTAITPTPRTPPAPRKTPGDPTTTTTRYSRPGNSRPNNTPTNDDPPNHALTLGAQFRYKNPTTGESEIRCTACCQIAHKSHSSTNCNYFDKWKMAHRNEPNEIKNSTAREYAIKRLNANNMTLNTHLSKTVGTNSNYTNNDRDKTDTNRRPTKRSKSPPQVTLTTTTIDEMEEDNDTTGLGPTATSGHSSDDDQNIFTILNDNDDNNGYSSDVSVPKFDGYSSDVSVPKFGDDFDDDATTAI